MTDTQHTKIEADRHKTVGEVVDLADPLGTDFQAEPTTPVEGVLSKLWDFFFKVATPQERAIILEDEQAHRLVSGAAMAKISESIERLIDTLPGRVEVAPSETIAFAQTYVPTTTPARLLAGRQPDRLRVRIRNTEASDGNSIFLGGDPMVTTATGYELIAGDEIEISTRAPIYAIAETASVRVDLIVEFGDARSDAKVERG